MNHKKGIAIIALLFGIFGLYLSGAMVTYFFGVTASDQFKTFYNDLLLPILTWIASSLIIGYAVYELGRD